MNDKNDLDLMKQALREFAECIDALDMISRTHTAIFQKHQSLFQEFSQRIEKLEKENECLRKELSQISLIN